MIYDTNKWKMDLWMCGSRPRTSTKVRTHIFKAPSAPVCTKIATPALVCARMHTTGLPFLYYFLRHPNQKFWKNRFSFIKSIHFKRSVTRFSFLAKSVVIFSDFVLISVKMTTLFARNENRGTDFLKWMDFKCWTKFHYHCCVFSQISKFALFNYSLLLPTIFGKI